MKKRKFSIADFLIKIFIGVLSVLSIFPFYQTILISLSREGDKYLNPVFLLPVHINFSAYTYLLKEGKVVNGLLVTLFVTIAGTLLSLAVTIPAAYALTKKNIPGRNFIMNLIIFTMFFSGGLVPYFITVKNLGLINNIAVMIIPTAVNTFNLILMKNFFKDLPVSLEESAKLDGASDFTVLLRIVVPTSKPIIAAISLFYAVDRWNEWWNAMLFINDSHKQPLQLVLRNAIVNMSTLFNNVSALEKMQKMGDSYAGSVQNAIIVIAAVPILLVYPFVQKYFASGIMIGSIKE
ncbi:MAG: carbohydrate ABC transporter permease [Anaerocolumna sp.]